MTKEEARTKAERKVLCFMTKETIDYKISRLKIKCEKSRSAKEEALINYYAKKWSSEESTQRHSIRLCDKCKKLLGDKLLKGGSNG